MASSKKKHFDEVRLITKWQFRLCLPFLIPSDFISYFTQMIIHLSTLYRRDKTPCHLFNGVQLV